MKTISIHSELKRYPYHQSDLLRAWDSADELILEHLNHLDLSDKRILILCDSFGALSSALQTFQITTYSDSYLSSRAIELNTQGRIAPLHDLAELSGLYDLVLIRIPKNMSFFEDILCQLSPHLHEGSQVICGYMIKHQANSSFELLGKLIGETRTSLAKKKARLIFSQFQKPTSISRFPIEVVVPGFQYAFTNFSNLFSRESLDIGTRFLLENLPQGNYSSILDLGCGNGIVGIAAKLVNPKAHLVFSDESYMAVQSVRINYQKYFSDEAQYLWNNCYEGQPGESVDLVLCNPPFHQGNTVGDVVAKQMFRDAKSALKRGSILRVVGNHHLKYPAVLMRLFGNSEVIATNRKFMIVDAMKE